jgi:hypothetical protein
MTPIYLGLSDSIPIQSQTNGYRVPHHNVDDELSRLSENQVP